MKTLQRANWGEPEQAPHKLYSCAQVAFILLLWYMRLSPARCYVYCMQYAIYSNTSLEAGRKNFCVSRVRVLQVLSVRIKVAAQLKEDDAIDQSVSVSESPQDKRDRWLQEKEPFE